MPTARLLPALGSTCDLAQIPGGHLGAGLPKVLSTVVSRQYEGTHRVVKRAISKFQARGPNINRRSYKATLDINILAASGP